MPTYTLQLVMSLVITLPSGAVENYCDEYVLCVCLCLFVRKDISGTTRTTIIKLFMHVSCGSRSVHLWRRCNTSSFVDDIMFFL